MCARSSLVNVFSSFVVVSINCINFPAPSGPPGTPSLRTSTPTSIELTWTNIECLQQKGIITNFTIRYRLQGSTQDITVNTQTATTSFNVTGLSAFTAYTFSVAGSNSIGMGGFSATANLRTTEDSK